MRRALGPSAVLLLVLVASGSAFANDPDQPPPDEPRVRTQAELKGRYPPQTAILATYDGCWLDYELGYGYHYGVSPYCQTAKLTLYRHGKFVRVLRDGSRPSEGDSSWAYDWTCERTGRWDYRLTYENRSWRDANHEPFRSVTNGHFRVPRCKREVPRNVTEGLASKRAYDETQGRYEGEFVTAIRCAAVVGRSSWTCHAQHNNTYRVCDYTLRLDFYGRDKWSRRENGYQPHPGHNSCQNF